MYPAGAWRSQHGSLRLGIDLAALHTSADSAVRAPRDDEDVFEPGFELDTEEHKEWLKMWRE